ncbi:uncharacterized protein LOC122062425 isoform X2 [Macadamia integrifolia]|uniref:uncharacterized protein LOC122062425 isoform X2 n=1 Tax=Macadamia integrifolia TaxID=60698 RepID=UPI001C4F5B88|nr:uncharacterized protein LOC122062425 isoform X2 [Macadamia integrifolia]
MAAFSSSPLLYMSKNPISLNFPSPIVFFLPCYHHAPSPHLHFRALCALKTGSDGGSVGSRDAYNSEILRKPVMSSVDDDVGSAKAAISNSDFGEPAEEGKKGYKEEDEWVDWEDRILQDTVPLVGFVRMILHSGSAGMCFQVRYFGISLLTFLSSSATQHLSGVGKNNQIGKLHSLIERHWPSCLLLCIFIFYFYK